MVEHHSGLDPARWIAQRYGATVVTFPVDRDGTVDLDALRDEVSAHGDEIALVSIMWANNEVGSIQPVAEVVVKARGSSGGSPVPAPADRMPSR